MGIIAFIILGAIAGAIAKALLPGDDPGGFIITTLIGIVGAILGGFLAAALFGADPMDEFWDLSTWLTAIVGSIVLLLIYRAVAGRGGTPRHGLAGRLEGKRLAAARERAHGREPPAVLAPDVGEDAQRLGARSRRRGGRGPRRGGSGGAGRSRVRSRRRPRARPPGVESSNSRRSATVLWWMWPARIRSAPASTSPARTRFRFATGFFRERQGAPSRWWWRATIR